MVSSVAFSPDGQVLLTGSNDKTVQLWDRRSGRKLARLEGHTSWVTSVVFSPDGRLATTYDGHGWVFFWQVQMPGQGRLLSMYVAT